MVLKLFTLRLQRKILTVQKFCTVVLFLCRK